MEIDQLRQELNDLLDNVVEHSENYSGNRQIPSLEISYVLTKINKMQETLIVLKNLLKEEERENKRRSKAKREQETIDKDKVLIEEKVEIVEVEPIVETEKLVEPINEEAPVQKVAEVKKPNNIEQLPIAKLVDALSLNDRYLFANELFDKDMSAFNDTVKSIDESANFEAAKVILMENGNQREWDIENEHVLSFTNLVERRFL